jgi:Adenylate and Guanylate cyclase catalytic domain
MFHALRFPLCVYKVILFTLLKAASCSCSCCIPAFSQILAQVNDPSKIMMYLNDLFGLFDVGVTLGGCYKLETVGDAYIVAVGLLQQVSLPFCDMMQIILSTLHCRASAVDAG